MSEEQVVHLYKLSSTLPKTRNTQTMNLLKSYYLMKCKEVTKSRDLPVKYFSPKVRCSHCFMEWTRDTEIKIRPVKLSKRQRSRIKNLKVTKKKSIEEIEQKKNLLNSNEVVKVCTLCKHSHVEYMLKPDKWIIKDTHLKERENNAVITNKSNSKKNDEKPIQGLKDKPKVNVYCSAKEVFSLSNKGNTLPNLIAEPKKVIKNNKKKKDKFAGLCQKAVLASMKSKQEKEKRNKLNLFLKPLTG